MQPRIVHLLRRNARLAISHQPYASLTSFHSTKRTKMHTQRSVSKESHSLRHISWRDHCLRTMDFKNGLAIADSAVHLGLTSKEKLLRFFEQQDKRTTGYAQALVTLRYADARAENGGESIARAIIIEQGFMVPDLQHEVPDPVDDSHVYRVDFWWEIEGQAAIVGELDGHDKYVDRDMTDGRSIVEVMADERIRESRVSGTGAKVMRFLFADVLNTSYFVHLLESLAFHMYLKAWQHPYRFCLLRRRTFWRCSATRHFATGRSTERRRCVMIFRRCRHPMTGQLPDVLTSRLFTGAMSRITATTM